MDCGIVDQRFIANNAGLLFFSKNPMDYIKHAYVVGALYKGVDKITVLDRKEMKGNIIDVIQESKIKQCFEYKFAIVRDLESLLLQRYSETNSCYWVVLFRFRG